MLAKFLFCSVLIFLFYSYINHGHWGIVIDHLWDVVQ